jgi:hypothetical protein
MGRMRLSGMAALRLQSAAAAAGRAGDSTGKKRRVDNRNGSFFYSSHVFYRGPERTETETVPRLCVSNCQSVGVKTSFFMRLVKTLEQNLTQILLSKVFA